MITLSSVFINFLALLLKLTTLPAERVVMILDFSHKLYEKDYCHNYNKSKI